MIKPVTVLYCQNRRLGFQWGDEASGGDGGVEQNAEISCGGSGSSLPPQALQPLCQANQQVHGS